MQILPVHHRIDGERQIELAGFKSFREPTRIPLAPGLNAVVGPNGCGKSNVTDAIRWVLGEQSVRNLRAESMAANCSG